MDRSWPGTSIWEEHHGNNKLMTATIIIIIIIIIGITSSWKTTSARSQPLGSADEYIKFVWMFVYFVFAFLEFIRVPIVTSQETTIFGGNEFQTDAQVLAQPFSPSEMVCGNSAFAPVPALAFPAGSAKNVTGWGPTSLAGIWFRCCSCGSGGLWSPCLKASHRHCTGTALKLPFIECKRASGRHCFHFHVLVLVALRHCHLWFWSSPRVDPPEWSHRRDCMAHPDQFHPLTPWRQMKVRVASMIYVCVCEDVEECTIVFRFWYISKCYPFLKTVLSFSKSQLNFPKMETVWHSTMLEYYYPLTRIMRRIHWGCSRYK